MHKKRLKRTGPEKDSVESLSDSEIKSGQKVEPLELGDLLSRGEISEPITTLSGLIYGCTLDGKIFWAELN